MSPESYVPMDLLTYILVFIATSIADYIWSEWMSAVADARPIRAGLYSMGTILCGSFVIMSYVQNPKYLIPACIGAFIGTYISVKNKINEKE